MTACRLALVGAGAWGQNLLRLALAHPHVALVAVVDPDPAARALVASRAPHVRIFSTLDDALACPLDALVVASPARTHFALARAGLEAGLAVLVEKPLTVSPTEADQLASLARRRRQLGMVGHLLRFHPAVRRLLDEVRRGTIGTPRLVQAHRRSPPGRPSDVSALWALGPHDLSILLALDASPVIEHRTSLGPEHASLWLRTEAGLEARVQLSRQHPTKERRLRVVGTEGTLTFDDLLPGRPLTLLRAGRELPDSEVLPVAAGEPLALELDHFVESWRHGRDALTPLEDGARVVHLLDRLAGAEASPRVEAWG